MNQQLQLEPDTSAPATGSGSGSRDSKMAPARRRGGDVTARSRRQQQGISGSGANAVKQESLTHDIVARIYREELAKLAAAAEATGNTDELVVYRRELERLSCSTSSGGATESWMESGSDCLQSSANVESLSASPSASIYSENSSDRPQDLRVVKKEVVQDGAGTGLEPIRRVGSAFTPVQPRATTSAKPTTPVQPPCCDVIAGSVSSSPGSVANDASPLKQMQTIANLLLPKHSHQRPLRAVLPPITQVLVTDISPIKKADIALRRNPISELRDVTCHMRSHSVTCHPTQVNAPRLTPAMQAGTRFTYPGGMGG